MTPRSTAPRDDAPKAEDGDAAPDAAAAPESGGDEPTGAAPDAPEAAAAPEEQAETEPVKFIALSSHYRDGRRVQIGDPFWAVPGSPGTHPSRARREKGPEPTAEQLAALEAAQEAGGEAPAS